MKPFSTILAAGLFFLAVPSSRCGQAARGGAAEYDEETVHYPAGWRNDSGPGSRGPEVGIHIYHNYVWFDQSRPKGETDWATITLTRWNCPTCINGAHPATLTDFLKDKDCSAPKCAYAQSNCPVHSPGVIPAWRITNKCPLVDRYPKMVGGVCGKMTGKKKHAGTVYYYFDGETEGTGFSEPGEHLKETTVIFRKGRFIYTADLTAPLGEFGKYTRDLDTVLWTLAPKPGKRTPPQPVPAPKRPASPEEEAQMASLAAKANLELIGVLKKSGAESWPAAGRGAASGTGRDGAAGTQGQADTLPDGAYFIKDPAFARDNTK